ncbi:MAG: hypothetical protein NT150_09375 [Bacteroidetes bacterium]|nr:hypothetical protein [Bacteroidota bacterium]
MVNIKTELLDKFQFDIVLKYPFHSNMEKEKYKVKLYYFLPRNLLIDRYNYREEDFLKDVQNLLHFSVPLKSKQELICDAAFSIRHIEEIIFQSAENRDDQEMLQNFEFTVKLFVVSFKEWAVDYLRRAQRGEVVNYLEFINDAKEIWDEFRKLKEMLINLNFVKHRMNVFLYADEYICIFLLSFSYQHIRVRDEQILKDFIRETLEYQELCKYESMVEPEGENENVMYRSSTFRKYFLNGMFLRPKVNHKEINRNREYAFAIGAAVAMIFATGVAFYFQQVYGQISFMFFMSLVVGYILKDRIKEWVRDYAAEKMKGKMYDMKYELFSDNKKNVGYRTQRLSFLKEKAVPEEILNFRRSNKIMDIESEGIGQNIMLFEKHTNLYSVEIEKLFDKIGINEITDILRFNVMGFTKNMEEADRDLYYMYEETIKKVKADRVYHINLVFQFDGPDDTHMKRYRLVMNKKGIKRIEEILLHEKVG